MNEKLTATTAGDLFQGHDIKYPIAPPSGGNQRSSRLHNISISSQQRLGIFISPPN
jgi:hypothetical protein